MIDEIEKYSEKNSMTTKSKKKTLTIEKMPHVRIWSVHLDLTFKAKTTRFMTDPLENFVYKILTKEKWFLESLKFESTLLSKRSSWSRHLPWTWIKKLSITSLGFGSTQSPGREYITFDFSSKASHIHFASKWN